MPLTVPAGRRLAASLLLLSSLALLPLTAAAQSKRDRAAVEVLTQRMVAAEAKYKDALVKVGNDDPAGVAQGNSALEDMEDVITACGKQKGCVVAQLLPTYKRLLKADVDARGAQGEGDEDATLTAEAGEMPTGDVPETAEASALLNDEGQRFVQMVQFNPAVQAGIRRWLTDMRVSLIQSHENFSYMSHLMSPSFKRAGLPEALLFGIMAKESNGKVHVGSRAGAVGPLQFMPATGKRFGLGNDGTGFDTRYDPRLAADAAAAYLNERYAQLDHSIEMSLAAYNGGEGRALRVYRDTGGRSFWDADVYNQFPAETKDYVPMVIAAAWLYLHPRQYGLVFPKIDARPTVIKLAAASSIYELTICLGNGGTRDGYMRVLRNLNPRLEPGTYLPSGSSINATMKMAGLYNRWCVRGDRIELARQLVASNVSSAIVQVGEMQTVSPPVSSFTPADGGSAVPTTVATGVPAKVKPKAPRQYKVVRGDTLAALVQRYDCEAGDVAKANGLKAPRYMLRPGQTLKMVGCAK